jgi:hypothetical protein
MTPSRENADESKRMKTVAKQMMGISAPHHQINIQKGNAGNG